KRPHRREAMDPSLLLCRDQLECSVEMGARLDSSTWPKNAAKLNIKGSTLTLVAGIIACVSAYLLQLLR
ncbi:MAG TPA: hypothetical protein VNB29_11505, partial [Chthoniobacterales bacterium]|nr:hypothetical protein [Chthoniobacterales bacterium]